VTVCERIVQNPKQIDTTGSVWFNLSTAYLANKQTKKARTAANEFTRVRKGEARGYILIGDTFFADGDWGNALDQYTRAEKAQVVVATKVRGRVGPGVNQIGLSRAHIFASIDASLRCHRDPAEDLLTYPTPAAISRELLQRISGQRKTRSPPMSMFGGVVRRGDRVLAEPRSARSRTRSAGFWKLADFGIARLRERQRAVIPSSCQISIRTAALNVTPHTRADRSSTEGGLQTQTVPEEHVATRRGRGLFASAARDAWGPNVNIVDAVATMYNAGGKVTLGVIRGDDPNVVKAESSARARPACRWRSGAPP